jgi:hypothetical protein
VTLVNTVESQVPSAFLHDVVSINCIDDHQLYGTLQDKVNLTCQSYNDTGRWVNKSAS